MKWDAWNKLKGMDRIEASNKFIIASEKILKYYNVKYQPLPEHLQDYDNCLQNLDKYGEPSEA